MKTLPRRDQSGLALVLVLFVLVIATALMAAATVQRERTHWEWQLAVYEARAAAAADAGLQWAVWRLQQPVAMADAQEDLPDCWTEPQGLTLPGTLAEFAVSIACVRTPAATAPVPYVQEGNRRRVFYSLSVIARLNGADDTNRVERRHVLRMERCVRDGQVC